MSGLPGSDAKFSLYLIPNLSKALRTASSGVVLRLPIRRMFLLRRSGLILSIVPHIILCPIPTASVVYARNFRRFSGHTQVNATDLRLLKYPERAELKKLGRWVQNQGRLTQEMIDEHVAAAHGKRKKDC